MDPFSGMPMCANCVHDFKHKCGPPRSNLDHMIKDDIITEIRWMSHVAPTWYSFLQIMAEESKQRQISIADPLISLDGHHSTSNFRRSLNVGSSASIFIGKEKSGFEDTIQRSA